MTGALCQALGERLATRPTTGVVAPQRPQPAPPLVAVPRRRPAGAHRRADQLTPAVLTVKLSNGDLAVDEVEALRPPPLPTTQAVLLEGPHCWRRPVAAVATAAVALPSHPAARPATAGFGWQSWQGNAWWRTLRSQVPDLAELGITHM